LATRLCRKITVLAIVNVAIMIIIIIGGTGVLNRLAGDAVKNVAHKTLHPGRQGLQTGSKVVLEYGAVGWIGQDSREPLGDLISLAGKRVL
jgi:hypothetical protein